MGDLSERKPNSFTPVVKATELANYVLHITDNPKTFPTHKTDVRQREDGTLCMEITALDDTLVQEVKKQAHDIYMNVSRANRINLNYQPYRKRERLMRQLEAISLCEDHLCTIQLCRKHFHLSSKRIKYWGKMVVETRNAIEKWHESDVSRYGRI